MDRAAGFPVDGDGPKKQKAKRKRRDSSGVSSAATSDDTPGPILLPRDAPTPFLLQYLQESVHPALQRQELQGSKLYGMDIPNDAPPNVCSGCHGQKHEKLQNEPILLCDGPNCGREYHISCCVPPIATVPEADWLCFDCSLEGTTSALRRYLEESDQKRAEFSRSERAKSETYVDALVREDCQRANVPADRFPLSEVARGGTTHSLAVCDATDLSRTRQGSESRQPLVPADIVGRPVRLAIPSNSEYHTGRVVDCRPMLRIDTISSTTEKNSVDTTEFLVRFVAGKDGRKTSYHHWMVLEEHPLLLGTTMVFAQVPAGVPIWKPAMVWLRTSRQLVSVQEVSTEGEILYRRATDALDSPQKTKHKVMALVRAFGQDTYTMLNARDQAVDLANLKAAENYLKDSANQLTYQLAQVEQQEQSRVRQWQSLRQENPYGLHALSSRDAYNLPRLVPHSMKRHLPTHCDLCPSVMQGLDRGKILRLLEKRGVKPTKDVAATLKCDIVNEAGVDFCQT